MFSTYICIEDTVIVPRYVDTETKGTKENIDCITANKFKLAKPATVPHGGALGALITEPFKNSFDVWYLLTSALSYTASEHPDTYHSKQKISGST